MDLQEFLSWLDTEFSKYSVLAKSNPRSLNELVYVLRRTDRDFSINWETAGGFASIRRSVRRSSPRGTWR